MHHFIFIKTPQQVLLILILSLLLNPLIWDHLVAGLRQAQEKELRGYGNFMILSKFLIKELARFVKNAKRIFLVKLQGEHVI